MKFLINFCGKKTLVILFVASMLSLLLDLLSIALIFPFLKLFISPEIIRTNRYVQPLYQPFEFSPHRIGSSCRRVALIAVYLLKLVFKTVLNE